MIRFIKKFALLFVVLFSIWISFAYMPTNKDIQILNQLKNTFKKEYQKDPAKFDKISNNITKLKQAAINDERLYYLVTQLESIVNDLMENDSIKHWPYKIIEIIDGDTIKINYNWKNQNVRMIWIDAPENDTSRFWYIECYWDEAYNYLVQLIWNNEEIELEFDKTQWSTDKYWRLLWYIFIDWNNINKTMIQKWYAREYTYSTPYKYQQTFKNAEKSAKNNKNWLWNKISCNWERKSVDEVDILDNLINLIDDDNNDEDSISTIDNISSLTNSSSYSNNTSSSSYSNNSYNYSNYSNSYSSSCWSYIWHEWPRWWCYHWSKSGKSKVYWSHSCCK